MFQDKNVEGYPNAHTYFWDEYNYSLDLKRRKGRVEMQFNTMNKFVYRNRYFSTLPKPLKGKRYKEM